MNLLNRLIVSTLPAVPRPVVRYFAGRYIAGEELPDAVRVVRGLNGRGVMATLDVLGEHITRKEEASAARDMILSVLDAISRERLDSNVSVKLTQLGLQLDRSFCLENVRSIVQRAADQGSFVRIDMEDSSTTDDTIWVYRQLRRAHSNVGIVLQACLRRTAEDAAGMIRDALSNFRLCKGIYVEPEAIAFRKKQEVNDNFIAVLTSMLEAKAYVGIATHDDSLVEAASGLVRRLRLEKKEYEFQMLLGVRPELMERIRRDGHRLRIYVPFGKHWYQYSIRRFKENPQIAGYVIKSLMTGSRLN